MLFFSTFRCGRDRLGHNSITWHCELEYFQLLLNTYLCYLDRLYINLLQGLLLDYLLVYV